MSNRIASNSTFSSIDTDLFSIIEYRTKNAAHPEIGLTALYRCSGAIKLPLEAQ